MPAGGSPALHRGSHYRDEGVRGDPAPIYLPRASCYPRSTLSHPSIKLDPRFPGDTTWSSHTPVSLAAGSSPTQHHSQQILSSPLSHAGMWWLTDLRFSPSTNLGSQLPWQCHSFPCTPPCLPPAPSPLLSPWSAADHWHWPLPDPAASTAPSSFPRIFARITAHGAALARELLPGGLEGLLHAKLLEGAAGLHGERGDPGERHCVGYARMEVLEMPA